MVYTIYMVAAPAPPPPPILVGYLKISEQKITFKGGAKFKGGGGGYEPPVMSWLLC